MATALAFLMLTACTGSVTNTGEDTNAPTDLGTIETAQDFTSYLLSEGHAVTPGGTTSQTFFTQQGTMMTIDGQTVVVFEFSSEEEAQQTINTISEDATEIGDSPVEWVDEPHFYQDGRLIVLYTGNDDETLDTLEDALGAQVAGGSTDDEDDLIPGGETVPTDDPDDF